MLGTWISATRQPNLHECSFRGGAGGSGVHIEVTKSFWPILIEQSHNCFARIEWVTNLSRQASVKRWCEDGWRSATPQENSSAIWEPEEPEPITNTAPSENWSGFLYSCECIWLASEFWGIILGIMGSWKAPVATITLSASYNASEVVTRNLVLEEFFSTFSILTLTWMGALIFFANSSKYWTTRSLETKELGSAFVNSNEGNLSCHAGPFATKESHLQLLHLSTILALSKIICSMIY